MSNKKAKFSKDMKMKIVQLYKNGKSKSDIVKEYSIAASTLYKWINQYDNSGSFTAKDNRTETENELIILKKKYKDLEMENDLLKQLAVVHLKK